MCNKNHFLAKTTIFSLLCYSCFGITNAIALPKQQIQEYTKTCNELNVEAFNDYNELQLKYTKSCYYCKFRYVPVEEGARVAKKIFIYVISKKQKLDFLDSVSICKKIHDYFFEQWEMGYTLKDISYYKYDNYINSL